MVLVFLLNVYLWRISSLRFISLYRVKKTASLSLAKVKLILMKIFNLSEILKVVLLFSKIVSVLYKICLN